MKAVLLISHGSRSSETKREISQLVDRLRSAGGADIIEFAFLELETPSIPQGIDMCVEKGATRVIVLLNFLNSGRHVNVDIPAIVEESKKKYPDISISITIPVGQHPGIDALFLDIIK